MGTLAVGGLSVLQCADGVFRPCGATISSPFLQIPAEYWVASNALAFAIRDRYPVTDGHTLVIPKNPVPTWFDARRDEQHALMDLVEQVRRDLERSHSPDGFNIGINIGASAGQTVMHLHVHVIPRYSGDMPDPRGGVRHVIPEKGNYLKPPSPDTASAVGGSRRPALSTGAPDDPFLSHLQLPFARASEVSILAAFVQDAGLELLDSAIRSALQRGARVRLLTGDYLHITQARALRRLLDWQQEWAAVSSEHGTPGVFGARVVEIKAIEATSFHPKAWCFSWSDAGVAFVGSSNISKAALATGLEWNLRVDRSDRPDAFDQIAGGFDRLWTDARPLTTDWVDAYAVRARRETTWLPAGEAEVEAERPQPQPRPYQQQALDQLVAARAEGRRRSLVVMATGLGKTLLAAFDAQVVLEERDGGRVLVLAHRAELLRQAAETFRWLMPDARFSWCVGDADSLDGEVVFASVQKLHRPQHLGRLTPGSFDYVVVDEVHHAAAKTWRTILDHLDPHFMLGLTATPERSDDADILSIFDDHVAHEAGLAVGLETGFLVPFRYHGLKDTTDFEPIPWRSGRFATDALTRAVQTEARMQRMWEGWQDHPATRTIVFCCSIDHAEYVGDWLRARGLKVAVLHSGPTTDDRRQSLADLRDGTLEVVCAVDLLNEGVDIPRVDRVVMLRPTESRVLFLQQLGRGLRTADGKDALIVLDFVGNHRMFLDRVRTLLSLAARTTQPLSLRQFLAHPDSLELPAGCSVEVELEAIALLQKLLPSVAGNNATVLAYREWRQARGRRPHAGELLRAGHDPRRVARGGHGWFDFVQAEGDLSQAEVDALRVGGDWLREVQGTQMSKCFKMVVLEVLLEEDALFGEVALPRLAQLSHRILTRDPALFADLKGVKALPEPRSPDPLRWARYWRDNPIKAWAGRRWFSRDGERFSSRIPQPDDPEAAEALVNMTRELVDLRLAAYRRRRRVESSLARFTCTVGWSGTDPVLVLPVRSSHPGLPAGELDVRLSAGEAWQFRLEGERCRVARPVATDRNRLPDLLRDWFGPTAGHPDTHFEVRFSQQGGRWWCEPVGAKVVALFDRRDVRAFPDIAAAAGRLDGTATISDADVTAVRLPVERSGTNTFAVRVTGQSMAVGTGGIQDGDWSVLRWARGDGLGSVEGRVALVAVGHPDEGVQVLLKRVVRVDGGWVLRSDNPDFDDIPAGPHTTLYAVQTGHFRPEDLGPPIGTLIDDDELAEAFGLASAPEAEVDRVGGHLFLSIDREQAFSSPSSLPVVVSDRRAAETAFILVRVDDRWRYCGVGRWEAPAWTLPELDFASWRAVGKGRGVSRTLHPKWMAAARVAVEGLLARVDNTVRARGRHCVLEGRSPRGGLRVSGGPDGFKTRTISLIDLGWVLQARAHAAEHGASVDEDRVNRLRYLEGTPKGSTKWVDTGWALVLTEES